MNSPRLELGFAEPLSATEIAEWHRELAEAFPDWPQSESTEPPADAARTRGGTLEWITLIVSIPSGILAVWDLAERMKLKARVVRLIAWAKERRARGQKNPFVVATGGASVPLDEACPEQLLDAVENAARAQQKGRA